MLEIALWYAVGKEGVKVIAPLLRTPNGIVLITLLA